MEIKESDDEEDEYESDNEDKPFDEDEDNVFSSGNNVPSAPQFFFLYFFKTHTHSVVPLAVSRLSPSFIH